MANQVVVTNSGNVQVSIEPQPNVQVQISRAAIGNITVSNVSTANFANYAGNVVNANQPNITSVGTLTGLTSSGNITAPFFLGNVIGNISGNIVVPGTNTSVLFNQLGNAGASDAFQFNYASNTVSITGNLIGGNISGNGAGIANIAGANVTGQVSYAAVANSVAGANVSGQVAFANTANNVAGANVSGQVSYAATANSVAVGNVVGIGNIATVNLDGNASNILYGNGSFASPAIVNNVANANYANFAGDVVNSTQSNITTLGTLTGLSINGNITGNLLPSANITYDLGSPTQRFKDLYLSNNSIYLGAQTINANATSVNFSGVLAGDGSGLSNIAGANVTGTVANANYASYSNVANSANSVAVGNISGIGNIATLNLDGNASNILYGNGSFATPPVISNVANANYANFAGTAYSVSGSNVSGEVANANYSNFSNVANTANSVSVGNVSGIGNIATVNLDGNAGNILYGNGTFAAVPNVSNVANANYANFAGTAYSVSGSNVSGEVANANYASYANISNIANTAYSVSGSNVSGEVANANYASYANIANTANSVSVGNVSGIGNIATVNLDGNAGNILYGNGIFATVPVVSNVANANYANFAGTAYSVSGSNVSGEVANANYASYANIANTANSVSVGNVSGIGNIATVNLDGNNSNILYGNGIFAASPNISNVANANYANFAGTAYSVSGSNVSGEVANANYASYANISNIANTAYSVSGSNVSGEVANANYATFSGTAYSVSGSNVSGEVANANYASYANISNIANTAYSVSGANVSGEVANANYASYANIANTANSVAVGNVVGIGNIATINLDGNSSNALLGNGGFGPVEVQSTSIANGTSNVNIPTANGNITFSANNNANLIVVETTGQMNSSPLSTATSGLRINTIGSSPLNDAHRVTWARSRGTVASPTSVQSNDFVMSMVGIAHNGTSYNTTYPLLIRGVVDTTYTTNTANIPMGLRFTVAQTTQSGSSNISINHNFFSNGNVTFAQTVNAGNFAGDGSALSNITGANVTGTVANATYAIDAGNANIANLVNVSNANASTNSAFYPVFVNSTGNGALQLDNFGNTITYNPSLGVLTTKTATVERVGNDNGGENIDFDGTNNSIRMSVTGDSNALVVSNTSVDVNALTVNNGVAATPIYQILPNSISVGNTSNLSYQPYSSKITNDYGNGQLDGNLVLSSTDSTVRYRGNSTTPTALSAGDRIARNNYYGYNGTANILSVSTTATYANTNSNSNAVFSGGSYTIFTGNPLGDTGNANATSGLNTFTFDQYGRIVMTQGTAATGVTNGLIVINHYGGLSGANANTSAGIVFNRYFGNRDSNLGVGPGAQTGRIIFLGANTANTIFNTRAAQIVASVDSSYVAGNANIPQQMAITTCDNTTSYTSVFSSGGNLTIPKSIFLGNGAVQSQLYLTGDGTPNSGIVTVNGQFNSATDNANLSGGYSPFFFSQYMNSNNDIGSMRFFRSRGTFANRQPVQANDWILRNSIGVYADSGNTYKDVGEMNWQVLSNDNSGNIATLLTLGVGAGTTGSANSKINITSTRTEFGTGGNIGIVLYGNGYGNFSGRIDSLRTFGDFYSNATQTNPVANAVNYMTLNNTGEANGISIANNSEITIARTGVYNIQFSACMTHDTNQSANVEIWLAKNGNAVPNTNTRLTLTKDLATVAAWNWLANASTANDYFELAWASPDTNVEILYIDAANTVANVNIPSVIVTVTPVGA